MVRTRKWEILSFNDKCKDLAKKIKEHHRFATSFTDWLNNSNVRADLNQKIFFCLAKNGYPPQYNDEVFDQVMDQVENFKKTCIIYIRIYNG